MTFYVGKVQGYGTPEGVAKSWITRRAGGMEYRQPHEGAGLTRAPLAPDTKETLSRVSRALKRAERAMRTYTGRNRERRVQLQRRYAGMRSKLDMLNYIRVGI